MANPFALTQLSQPLRAVVQHATGLHRLRDWYEHFRQQNPQGISDFLEQAIRHLNIKLEVDQPENLNEIPASGPVIVVSNHPLGALEGLLLTQVLIRIRPDLKVLTNELLLNIPECRDTFIGVDVLSQGKAQHNAKGIRAVSRHLSRGGALLVFPAGTVSRIQPGSWSIQDAPWSPMIGKLAQKYQATCVPLYVHDRNARWFYLSGFIHKRLRTALLPWAMLDQQGKTVNVSCGLPIDSTVLSNLRPDSISEHLRVCSELLSLSDKKQLPLNPANHAPISSPEQDHSQPEHLANLLHRKVAESGPLAVYSVPFGELGCLADALAIEREKTFRAVGEGTGLNRDMDHFDRYYHHIFLWDQERQKIAGGYRAIRVQDAVAQNGVEGLYSHSLFHFRKTFVDRIGGAIELGRSFVSPEWQSNPKALDLLWKGLGNMVKQHPECHTLFGCVSISSAYSPTVRTLLADTLLSAHGAENELRSMVKPASRLSFQRRFWDNRLIESLSDVSAINKLLGMAAPDQKVPILIRHYLNMNGKFIDFSINHGFNQSLDGLIVVDLRQTPEKYLKRYMGQEAAKAFHQRWIQNHAA